MNASQWDSEGENPAVAADKALPVTEACLYVVQFCAIPGSTAVM
jgi:hypothetical protein